MRSETKLILETLNKRFDDMGKRIDDSISDGKDKHTSQQVALDRHCKTIKKMNEEIIGLRPMKKFYDKMRDFSMGVIILLGGTVISLCVYLKEHLFK